MASVEAGCFPTAAVWVKHLLDEWDRWPGGPLIVFPETLLSPGHHLRGVAGSGGRRPLQEPRRSPRSRLPRPGLPGSQRVIHRVWAHAACVADAAHPPRCQSFFHSLGEGLSRRAGPRALLPSHSSWSGPLRGHRALPLSPCLPGDIGADFHVASVGLGELYKH